MLQQELAGPAEAPRPGSSLSFIVKRAWDACRHPAFSSFTVPVPGVASAGASQTDLGEAEGVAVSEMLPSIAAALALDAKDQSLSAAGCLLPSWWLLTLPTAVAVLLPSFSPAHRGLGHRSKLGGFVCSWKDQKAAEE